MVQKITLKILFKENKLSTFVIILLSFLYSFLSTYPLALLKDLIDNSVKLGNNSDNITKIIILAIFYVACLLLSLLVLNFQRYYTSKTQYKLSNDMRILIYRKLNLLYQDFFDYTDSSDILTCLIQDSEIIVQGYISPITNLSKAIFSFCFGFYFMWQIHPILTLIILPIAIIIGLLTKFGGGKFKDLAKENRKKNSFLWKISQENIGGIRDIHSFNQENKKFNDYQEASKGMEKNMNSTAAYAFKMNMANNIASLFMTIIMLFLGILYVSRNEISIGAIVAIITFNSLLSTPIQNIVVMFQDLFKVKASLIKINKLIFEKKCQPSLEISNESKDSDFAISFRNVDYTYSNGLRVLNDITFSVERGKKVAIVGSTGSGKTTILKLCTGLYEIHKGSVNIMGYDVNIQKAKIRNYLGIAFQDVFLFNDTIKNNILFANPNATEELLQSVIYVACVDEIIIKLEKGINSYVGEKGVQLSGGEKQRIGVARALIKNPEVLLLDEATSSLDNETEFKMISRINENYKNITILMIAHRLASIKNADCIYYLEDGKILEKGTNEELLLLNRKYKKMYEALEKNKLVQNE